MASDGKQVRNGKAFEYAIAIQYYTYLKDRCNAVSIVENNAFAIAKRYFEGFPESERHKFLQAAYNTIDTMVRIEPGLTTRKNDTDTLAISLNDDMSGEKGDVRDIVFKRLKSSWEIGFSAKNNNDAVKHSRLGKNLDFGQAWTGIPCSDNYWKEIRPIFDYIEECIKNRYTWNDLGQNKRDLIYLPLLKAFKKELLRINHNNTHIPEMLLEYLIGNHPFYKIIKDDSHNLVIVKAFNINGGLNKPYNKVRPAYSTPSINLPHRIIEFEFKENSDTTLNMVLDGGWEISFRLHNASSLVERSLKFDIKLLGNPPILFSQYIFQ